MSFPTIPVLNASGAPVTVNTLPNAGQATMANSLSVAHASDDPVVLASGAPADAAYSGSGSGGIIGLLKWIGAQLVALVTAANSTTPSPVEVGPFSVKNIAASQTNAVVGATGAVGDYLSHIIIQPASTSPGVVTIYDGSTGGTNTTIYSFPGGATSLSNLAPLILALPAKAVNAGWHVTTGASVSVTLVGTFS